MDILQKYVERFCANDEELYKNLIDNAHAYEWLQGEIPLFECPDVTIEETYYFRYWTYRKHLKKTEEQKYIITEFLPKVAWSGKYNEINAAVGHHIYEGRWLKNSFEYLKDYIHFFLDHPERGHQYSAWMIYAAYQLCVVTGNFDLGEDFLEKACRYYEEWERTHLLPNGMFWSYDNYDAMEYSISGTSNDLRCLKGIRPTLNSYMCADAWAIAAFARHAGRTEIGEKYQRKYEEIKTQINKNLWQNGFYRAYHFENDNMAESCQSMIENPVTTPPKELIGYIPWMFDIPEAGKEAVFDALTDPNCFYTDFGITTADITDKRFLFSVNHECLWNGYIWPFAISQTLTAMRNMLRHYRDTEKYRQDFVDLVKQYAHMHKRITENGSVVNWIDEVRHPLRDEWSSREILKARGWKPEYGGYERGKDYNHSTFCDIIISGIVGVEVKNGEITVSPIIPDTWNYFKLENLYVCGDIYSIFYDKSGEKYHRGKGLNIYKNGQLKG